MSAYSSVYILFTVLTAEQII